MRGPLLLNFIEVTKFTLQTVHGQLSDNSKIPDNTKIPYSSLGSGICFLVAPPHQARSLPHTYCCPRSRWLSPPIPIIGSPKSGSCYSHMLHQRFN